MGALAKRYERKIEIGQGRQPSAHGIRIWLAGQLEWIHNQLDGGVEPDFEAPEGWFKATLPLHQGTELLSEYFQPHLDALQQELRAQGWNAVTFDRTPRGVFVVLWELRVPITVFPEDGVPFPAILEPGADTYAVAERIGSEGTWRYLPGGSREFVPAHRIKRILHGEEDAPGGE